LTARAPSRIGRRSDTEEERVSFIELELGKKEEGGRREWTNEIREKTESTKISDGSLGRLGLLLSSDDGDEGDVEDGEVLVSDSELELSHGLDERSRLDISNGSTELHERTGRIYELPLELSRVRRTEDEPR